MSRGHDYITEQAHQHPDSTAAIGLRAIREAQYRQTHQRQVAIKNFFSRLFGRGQG